MNAYASGNWLVKEGSEAEFVRSWQDWLQWTRDNVEGFRWARLMRSADEPRRFVSISEWTSEEARTGWKSHGEFQEGFQKVRSLTDEFVGGDYDEEVSIDAKSMAKSW